MIKRKNLISLLLLGAVITLSLVSCDPSKKYEKEESAQIQNYLNENSTLNFELKSSGLYFLSIQAGTGVKPQRSDTAYVKYTGKFLDGTVFDTNVGKPDTLIVPVDEGWLIPGFDEGISLMSPGEKAMLLIPSKLAYGPSGYYIINGYTPLLFDLELVKVKPGPGK